MSKIALEVKNVRKVFRLPTEQANGIKQAFVNWTKGIKGYKEFEVLKDISFKVEKGDFFGIVGRNGSGKSTLLKIISQIYSPEEGSVKVNGKLIPFIELGVGFNPELTGRENVYLNGALLGFSKDEVSAMYDEIVDFAELHEFMDQKLKNYSSGMQVRLAFSIAIKAQGDILVLDEVLAVGDEAFQRKCYSYFANLKEEKKTVILVTHSMDHVQRFCNKAALIDKGRDFIVGDPAEIAGIYHELNSDIKKSETSRVSNEDIEVRAKFINEKDKRLIFDFDIKMNKNIKNPLLTFTITNTGNGLVYRWVSDEEMKNPIEVKNGRLNFRLDIQNIFPNGSFSVEFGVKSGDRIHQYGLFRNIIHFELNNRDESGVNIYWKPESKFEVK